MAVEDGIQASPLDALIESVALEIREKGLSVREFSPEDVGALARAAITERGLSETVRDVRIGIRQEGQEGILHADLQLGNRVQGIDLENVKRDRRDAEEDPTVSQIRVKGLAQRTLANALLHGDINDIFTAEVTKRLAPKGVGVHAVGLHITPRALRVAVRG